MRSHTLAFVLAGVVQSVLEVSPDGVDFPISKVTCHSYGFLVCLASQAFNCSSDRMQASFAAQELDAYL